MGIVLRIGPLNKRITIEQVTETRDSYGAVVEAWGVFAVVNASVSPLVGREYIAAKQISADVTHKIRLRYLSGITPKMRISWDGRIFDIESILNVDECNREMVIMAREII